MLWKLEIRRKKFCDLINSLSVGADDDMSLVTWRVECHGSMHRRESVVSVI